MIDLTQLTPSFPIQPEVEVPRDNLVSQIAQNFGENCQEQALVGREQSGKTNLLAQFARQFPRSCISYFVNEDPRTQRQYGFLLAYCNQLAEVLGESISLEGTNADDLKNLLNRLVVDLNRRCKRDRSAKYFFVIDGIEWAFEGMEDDRIVDVLPQTYPIGPYLLYSCRNTSFEKLPHFIKPDKIIEPLPFNRDETRRLLKETSFSEQEIDEIHKRHEGNPGSLGAVYDAKRGNPAFSFQSACLEYERVREQQLRHFYDGCSDEVRATIEYLAASPTGLPTPVLAGVLNISEQALVEALHLGGASIYDIRDHRVEFHDEVFRYQYREILGALEKDRLQELLDYTESKYPRHEFLLTSLYIRSKDYDGLQKQLSVTAVLETLNSPELGVSSILQRLRSASELARERGDIEGLLKWSLGTSAVKSYLDHSINHSEVQALIAIGESEKALRKAYQLTDETNRIRLLSQVYTAMELRGERIPANALAELQILVGNLRVHELDESLIQDLAESIFPILPDEAVLLIEGVAKNSDGNRPVSLFAKVMGEASRTSVEVSGRAGTDSEDIGPPIGGLGMKWLEAKDFDELKKDVKEIKSTAAKEHFLRHWCRRNKGNQELAQAIKTWIEVINSDFDFVVTLMALRQISGLLGRVPLSSRENLIREMRNLGTSVLDSPKEEWVRFQLNLCEAWVELDQSESLLLVEQVLFEVLDEPLDLDVKSFCLARINSTLQRFFPEQKEMRAKVDHQFHEAFYGLLADSADQFEIVSNTLGALVEFDLESAYVIALELNTRQRKDQALAHVLRMTLLRRSDQDVSDFIKQIAEPLIAEGESAVLVRLLDELRQKKIVVSKSNLDILLKCATEMPDAARRALALGHLSVLYSSCLSTNENDIVDMATDEWRREQDLSIRIAVGYRLVGLIADVDLKKAQALFNEVSKDYLLPGASLAIGELESDFIGGIELATRAVAGISSDRVAGHIASIEKWIGQVPSKYVKGVLLSELASSLYRAGWEEEAARVMRVGMLPVLEQLPEGFGQRRLIFFCLPVLYRYDPDEAEQQSAKLSHHDMVTAWYLVLVWSFSQCFLGDLSRLDGKKLVESADRPQIKRSIELLKKITIDSIVNESIVIVANVLQQSYRSHRINYRQAVELMQEVEDWINSVLPDKNNIPHEGYLILALAELHRVKSIIFNAKGRNQSRSGMTKGKIEQAWESLIIRAKKLPNLADRVYVLTHVARKLHDDVFNAAGSEDLLLQAESELINIPNILDRLDRWNAVADAWHYIGNRSKAEYAVDQSVELARVFHGQSRDQILRTIVQTSYTIGDDNLASQVTARLDTNTPISGMLTVPQRTMSVEKLRKRPERVVALTETTNLLYEQGLILRNGAEKLLEDLITGKGKVDHTNTLADWLILSRECQADARMKVANWVVENWVRGTNRLHDLPVVGDVIELNRRLADEAFNLGRVEKIGSISDNFAGLSSKYRVFDIGEEATARTWLCDWIGENARKYVKVCDPYFGLSELEFLRCVNEDTFVLIVTTDKRMKNIDPQVLEREWKRFSARALPVIKMIIVPSDFERRFHDRVIVSESGGLDLGGSLNGLGRSLQKIAILTIEEAKELETKYLDSMLSSTEWLMDKGVNPSTIVIGTKSARSVHNDKHEN